MSFFLKISRFIDAVTERVGRAVSWLILAAVLISAGNAIIRKAFNMSSNGWLEIQWYLFSAVFLLGAGYTLLRHEHVKIDIIYGHLSKKAQIWIDILGTVFFLFPVALMCTYLSWPVFMLAFNSGELSSNAGGLILWPARLLMPVGFGLLLMQGISELIKRLAFLQGLIPDPTEKIVEKTAEEELAEAILKARGEAA